MYVLTAVFRRKVAISVEQLAHDLHHRELLLVDVRSSRQFCSRHIRGAENVNFSNVLLQRLLEGVVKLETVAPDLAGGGIRLSWSCVTLDLPAADS